MNANSEDPAEALVGRARGGDRAAFDALAAPALARTRGVILKMVGHPDEAEDVLQDSLMKAWLGIGGFAGDARFSTWLIAIARRAALDHLRARKRWRTEAQVAYGNLCAADPALGGEVVGAYADPDFAFDVRQHVAYCFACVARSLPAEEQAALVLGEVMELSAREAARVLGASDAVYRHRLAAARAAMRTKFEGLCALVSKTGICHQCKGLREVAAEARRGPPIPDVADFAARCAVVRTCDPGASPMRSLHDIFWRRTSEVEEQGLGATAPQSDCGRD